MSHIDKASFDWDRRMSVPSRRPAAPGLWAVFVVIWAALLIGLAVWSSPLAGVDGEQSASFVQAPE